MRPSELRDRLRSEHDDLTRRIVAIRAALAGDTRESVLTDEVKARVERFGAALAAHMAQEEAHLAPALEESTNWGGINLAELRGHHDSHRERLRVVMLALYDLAKAEESVVRAVTVLLDQVEAGIAEENAHLLTPRMLRDDVVMIDASDG